MRKKALRTALANDLKFEVFGPTCGHIWAPSRTEIDYLKNHPTLSSEPK
jgi:hypothetical protein